MRSLRFIFLQIFVLVVICFASGAVSAQKMTAEEVVAKHLESYGSEEARKNLKNIVATGLTQYRVLVKNTGGDGKMVFASEANKLLFGINLNIPTYQSDTFVFDGKKSKISYIISNTRSDLGDFLYRYEDVLKEGLFGGVLSTGWTLRDLESRKAKVSLEGTKKVGDREAYTLRYSPKGGSDLQIYIYIDQNNFEHLRTEYRRIIAAPQGLSPDASAGQREERQVLTEEFSDYKKADGINLPQAYRIHLLMDGRSGTREFEYKSALSEFYINQPLDPASFSTGSH